MPRFFDYRLRVYYADTDCYGMVWHGHYLRWFEAARVELSREANLDLGNLIGEDITLPVVELKTEFKRSAYLDDELTIRTRIKALTPLKIIFGYEVYNQKDELLATGETTLVALTRSGKLYRRLPEVLVKAYGPYLSESSPSP